MVDSNQNCGRVALSHSIIEVCALKLLSPSLIVLALWSPLNHAQFEPLDLTAEVVSTQCPRAIMNNALRKTYLLCKDPKSYLQAKSDAESRSIDGYRGYLVNIDDDDENEVIEDWLGTRVSSSEYANTSAADGGGAAYVWIGADDRSSEGRWVWQRAGVSGFPKRFWQGGANGSAVGGSYINWGSSSGGSYNEPDNYLGSQDGAAIALESWPFGSRGQWNDIDVDNRLYYVVEFDTVEGLDNPSGGSDSNGSGTIRVALEEPVNNETHMGVGNLRGWAVASNGISRLEILIDGAYAFDAPYGGSRGDVGGAFPDIENSSQSGYSLAFNYSGLSAGPHTITAIAHDGMGGTEQTSSSFEVVRFDSDFISGQNTVTLNSSSCTVSGDQIGVNNARIANKLYDLVMKWRTAEQGFEIIEIR
jgi:hypothetical protein